MDAAHNRGGWGASSRSARRKTDNAEALGLPRSPVFEGAAGCSWARTPKGGAPLMRTRLQGQVGLRAAIARHRITLYGQRTRHKFFIVRRGELIHGLLCVFEVVRVAGFQSGKRPLDVAAFDTGKNLVRVLLGVGTDEILKPRLHALVT